MNTELIRSLFEESELRDSVFKVFKMGENEYVIYVINNIFNDMGEHERQDLIWQQFKLLPSEQAASISLAFALTYVEYCDFLSEGEDHESQEYDMHGKCLVRWFLHKNCKCIIFTSARDGNGKCISSFVVLANAIEKKEYVEGENFIYEGAAYSHLSEAIKPSSFKKYALDHVNELSESYFLEPLMELYVKKFENEGKTRKDNPLAFVFEKIEYQTSTPPDELLKYFSEHKIKEAISRTNMKEIIEAIVYTFHLDKKPREDDKWQ